jgi:hypothetical protein
MVEDHLQPLHSWEADSTTVRSTSTAAIVDHR